MKNNKFKQINGDDIKNNLNNPDLDFHMSFSSLELGNKKKRQ